MPTFPQYQNAQLVEFANYRELTDSVAAVQANSGDIIEIQFSVNGTNTVTVTLPPIALGGPVLLRRKGKIGDNRTGTLILIPSPVDVANGIGIGAYGEITVVNGGDEIVVASDGATTWVPISKYHNTHDSW